MTTMNVQNQKASVCRARVAQ